MNAVAGLIIACLALTAYGLPDPQIVGGDYAVDGAYPYQVSLRSNQYFGSYFCGGAIISKNYVITCAQCIVPFIGNPYKLYVAVGSNYLNETNPSNLYRAINLIIHAGYNSLLHIHDIGLIKISEDIKFNEKVQPIALPTADRNFDYYPLVVTGWGRIEKDGQISIRLKEAIVRGYPHELCSRYKYVKETHICSFTTDSSGICNGDGGSPLVADSVLVGIVSYSYGSCGADAPTYTPEYFPIDRGLHITQGYCNKSIYPMSFRDF